MTEVLCIGSVLWDIVGKTDRVMAKGHDTAGRIRRIPGGVALNIAMTLARVDLRPALLSAVGIDGPGNDLMAACEAMGLEMGYVLRPRNLPTDRYMAIEDAGGLVAAIADAHTLEAAGAAILTPLRDGRLGSAEAPYAGLIVLDGNLTEALLAEIACAPEFAGADLRVAPASPGKARRLLPFLGSGRALLYVNRIEAELMLERSFADSAEAARALCAAGAARALVTDGAGAACDACAAETFTDVPPQVATTRITGAGDTFLAAHIAAEARGLSRAAALHEALACAARYVSGEDL